MKIIIILLVLMVVVNVASSHAADSLPPLDGRPAPTNLQQMWQGFDPLRDPLDTEIVREWKEDDATYRYVVFTIGTFKGQKARVAAFYGFPKSDKKLPALMHLHGGGQRAFIKDVKDAVKYGYVGLSVNWGGREMEDAKPGDKNTEYTKTLDPVGSPRNIGWFMYTLIARRGLTFLQQQPEVDPNRLGVYGHSMGGKITTDLAGIDKRVTAAVPSCGSSTSITYGGKIWNIPGSIGKMKKEGNVEEKTIDTQAYLPTLTCPILDLNPSNDHNSPIDLVTEDWEKIGSKEVYHSCAPHLGHAHLPETQVTQWLWFDQWLEHGFEMPRNPEIQMDFKSSDGVPRVIVKPDASRKIKAVDVYYSTETHIITRFWRDGEAKANGETYQAVCPIMGLKNPFYTFANITYELEEPFKTKYGIDRYIITSKELIILPDELAKAGVKATDRPSKLVEDFSRGWHDWYGSWDKNGGSMTTYKIKDPKWRGADGENLCLELKSARDAKVELAFYYNKWWSFDGNAKTGKYGVTKELKGSPDWQTISVGVDELQPQAAGLPSPIPNNWQYIADVNIKASVEGIRKIYWAKATVNPSSPNLPAAASVPAATTKKDRKDDLPELAGQSEEFKEAVRQSPEEEKKHNQNSTPAQATMTMLLWPAGKMPGKGPKEGAVEHALPSRGDNVMRLTDITEPTLAAFQTAGSRKAVPAVIICPGGAYQILAYDKEGTEIAAWLNSIGITGVVLKYRVPNNGDGAFQDIQRTIRLVKNHAVQWNIAPNKIGVMGFSAGGHLCARLSNNYEKSTYTKLDAADDENIRPDFSILIYPAYLKSGPVELSSQTTPSAQTPPTFMVHTEDDKTFITGSKLYHAALEAAQVPNEFFLCATGGHGYGLRSDKEVSVWPKRCQEWLTKAGILER